MEALHLSHSVAYSSLTYSIYNRPMSSINDNVIDFYKNREPEDLLDEDITGIIFHNNSKVKTGVKATCDATCFQMNILFLFLERCCKVKKSHSKCYKAQILTALYYHETWGN